MLIANTFYGADIALDDVKHIERLAFPSELRILQSVESWDDVVDVFDLRGSENLIVVSDGEGWFALFFRAIKQPQLAIFADFAKVPRSGPVDWHLIWDALGDEGFRQVYANLREHTSYKSFRRQEAAFRRRGIEILHERVLPESEMLGYFPGERVYEVVISLG